MVTFRERRLSAFMRPFSYVLAILAALLVGIVLLHALLFGPPNETLRATQQFIVTPDTPVLTVANALKDAGLVKQGWSFYIAYAIVRGEDSVRPGGYELSPSMDAWTVAQVLARAPYLAWVTIPEGLRKEQVVQKLSEALSWTDVEAREWLAATEATATDALSEGVYYADTYLVPSDQSPAQVVERLRDRFTEATSAYEQEAYEKQLSWHDVVTLASLIEKEAGKRDKALVAGILWNRLERNMMLQVDATLQYAVGSAAGGWWTAPESEDKYVESPFNTYQHVGLPPGPIATPSLESIEAVLNPTDTKCLYYLHDAYGRIHCSTNYKAHVANVNRYLK